MQENLLMEELNTLGYKNTGRMTSDAVTVSAKVALAGNHFREVQPRMQCTHQYPSKNKRIGQKTGEFPRRCLRH